MMLCKCSYYYFFYHTLSILNACLQATFAVNEDTSRCATRTWQMLQRATSNATGDLTSWLNTVSTFDCIRFWPITTWAISSRVRPNSQQLSQLPETIALHATIKKLNLFVIQLSGFIDIYRNLYVKMRLASHKHWFWHICRGQKVTSFIDVIYT